MSLLLSLIGKASDGENYAPAQAGNQYSLENF
jgi:hypothetical protein